MKVLKIITPNRISLTPLGGRRFAINQPTDFKMMLSDGTELVAWVHKNYVTDFRSGGPFVDRFIDQFGETPEIQICYLMHDLFYTRRVDKTHFQTREFADMVLRESLICAGLPEWKAKAVWAAVRLFGRKAYTDDDAYSIPNASRFNMARCISPVSIK